VVDHVDVLIQFYLPILGRIFESRIKGTFKLVGLVLGSLDEKGAGDVNDMNVYGGLVSNVFQLDFWECLNGADVDLFSKAFEADREAWSVFCNTFVCRQVEEDYTLECRKVSGAFCVDVLKRAPSLANDVSLLNDFVKRIVGGFAIETLDSDCLRICALVTKECGEGWCLDRMNSLAVSLWY
jgi:hypothetical protein